MKFKNAGIKLLAAAAVALGLGVTGAFAGVVRSINVTLPEAVQINGATLPGGSYRVNQVDVGSGESAFVFFDDSGREVAVAEATGTLSPADVNSFGGSAKTEFILRQDEAGMMHLNQMFIEGNQTGFRFVDQKK